MLQPKARGNAKSRAVNAPQRLQVGHGRGQLLLFAQLFQDRHQQAMREIRGFRANFAHDFRECERPVSIAFRPFEEFVRGLELAPNDLVRALPALAVLVELTVELLNECWEVVRPDHIVDTSIQPEAALRRPQGLRVTWVRS